MNRQILRRGFLGRAIGIAALVARPDSAIAAGEVKRRAGTRIKVALNAYSFNRPLMAGEMTPDDVIEYCASQSLDGVDMTGYYLQGYPKVPPDTYLYNLKKKACFNGVTISGTGVRNDFTFADPAARKVQIALVKDWIEVAQKLGATVIRVFSGLSIPAGSTYEKVLEYMIPAFQECAEYGKSRGVIVGLQHHDDFLKTADQTIDVVKAVNSDWFSVILDVGSLRKGDPYAEIESYCRMRSPGRSRRTCTWTGRRRRFDLPKIRAIIEKVGFRVSPIEALGQGDSRAIVTAFLDKVRKAMA